MLPHIALPGLTVETYLHAGVFARSAFCEPRLITIPSLRLSEGEGAGVWCLASVEVEM